jgi:hypothetical protein
MEYNPFRDKILTVHMWGKTKHGRAVTSKHGFVWTVVTDHPTQGQFSTSNAIEDLIGEGHGNIKVQPITSNILSTVRMVTPKDDPHFTITYLPLSV